MTIYQLIIREKARLLKEKSELERLIYEAPPETLSFIRNRSKNRTYYKWYVSPDKMGRNRTRKYLPRNKRDYARKLAEKGLHKARLEDIMRELKAFGCLFGQAF